jgi:predicted ABC-type ATPase
MRMRRKAPTVVVIAGPNGAGKSTAAPAVLTRALSVQEFVNADVIARGMSEFNPEGMAMAAGRVMLARLHEMAEQRQSFAFETTLASRSFAPWIADLVKVGYQFRLLFLWLESPELAVERVALRIKAGGHSVPPDVIEQRYKAGIKNFFELYRPLALTWHVYDNSTVSLSQLIARGRRETTLQIADLMKWNRFRSISEVEEET